MPRISNIMIEATAMTVRAETTVDATCPTMSCRLPRADPLTASFKPSTSAKQPPQVALDNVQATKR